MPLRSEMRTKTSLFFTVYLKVKSSSAGWMFGRLHHGFRRGGDSAYKGRIMKRKVRESLVPRLASKLQYQPSILYGKTDGGG